jgi:hypothetical protein
MQYVPKSRTLFAAVTLTALAVVVLAVIGMTTHSTMPRAAFHELRAVPGHALAQDTAEASVRRARIPSLVQRRSFTCGEARASVYAIWHDRGVINTYCFSFVATQGYVTEWLVLSRVTHRRYHVGKVQLDRWYTDMVWS